MGSPTPSRRISVPPLEPEIEAVEVLRASLNRLMNEDFSDIEDKIQLRQKYCGGFSIKTFNYELSWGLA